MSKKKNKRLAYQVTVSFSWLFSEYANVCEFLQEELKGCSSCDFDTVEVDADTFFNGDAYLKDNGLTCLTEVKNEK